MPSFTQLLTLVTLAAVSFATTSVGAHPHCPGAKVEKDTTIDVDGRTVHHTSMSCDTSIQARKVPRSNTPPQNVCGVNCSTKCSNLAGDLPPISEDCDTIENAIQILQGSQSDTFVVDPHHLETLTFGTCSYFFANAGCTQLEYCWSDLSSTGSAAGSACFPPVMPINSEGLCTASDGTWAAGAAHS